MNRQVEILKKLLVELRDKYEYWLRDNRGYTSPTAEKQFVALQAGIDALEEGVKEERSTWQDVRTPSQIG